MRKQAIGIWVVIAKIGPKLFSILIKFGKFLKLGKVSLGAASLAGYALLFTWQFAVVIVGSVLFHEYGHYWAMKNRGLKTRGIYLVPFVGGVAVSEDSFKTRGNEAFISFFGPIFGLALAAFTLGWYLMTKNPFLAAITGWMALINLFNLLPVTPLDGGRIIKSITFSVSSRLGLIILGLGLLILGFVATHYQVHIYGILLFIGALELFSEYGDYLKQKLAQKFTKALGIQVETDALMPAMEPMVSLASFGAYITLIYLLYSIMVATSQAPGAKVALDVLIDKEKLGHLSLHPIFMAIFALLLGLGIVGIVLGLRRKAKEIAETLAKIRQVDTLQQKDPAFLLALGELNGYDLDNWEDRQSKAEECKRLYRQNTALFNECRSILSDIDIKQIEPLYRLVCWYTIT